MCGAMESVLVVGGSHGLGRALALELGSREDIVTVASRHPHEFPCGGGNYTSLYLDITDPKSYEQVLAHANDFDFVYMTAGVYGAGPLAQMDETKIAQLVNTHVLGYMQFIAAFHKERMKAEKPRSYHLIVVGSTLAHVPGKMHAVLAGCKAAKVHFTRTFALELERDIPGSKVYIYNPWGMKTDFFAGTSVKTDSFMDPKFVVDFMISHFVEPYRSRPGAVEFTLDRAKDGSTLVLEGAQPPKV